MKRKRTHTKRKAVSLANRRKYRFVRPDEDMKVLWCPRAYIARYVAMVLRDFIPYNDSLGATPGEFCHFEDDEDGEKGYRAWHDCLEEMLFAFEFYAYDKDVWSADEETKRRVRHGLDLFAKYYGHLWN